MKVSSKKHYYSLILPSFVLFITAVSVYYFFRFPGPRFAQNLRNAVHDTLATPRNSFFSKKSYTWALPSYSNFIVKNVPDKEKVLVVNNQELAKGGMFVYYNIYMYVDKNILFIFNNENITTDTDLINIMRKNNIKYFFSFNSNTPVGTSVSATFGRGYILKLEDSLELVAVYE